MQTYCDTFASESACLTACADVNDLGGYTTSTQAGDSIQCRLYHVSAASLDPKTHCPHAAGEQICVAPMP
jgi:hypothetical protein